MNKVPEMSLFNDGVSINLNRCEPEGQRAEEEEELADQKRRNEEIGKELEKAFGDFDDDNDTLNSLNSQSNYTDDDDENEDGRSINQPPDPPVPKSPMLPSPAQLFGSATITNDYGQADRELRLLLESKDRELQCITKELLEKSRTYELQLSDLNKKLCIEQAEKERATMTRDQTYELLVQSKTKISELEDTNKSLRVKVSSLEDQSVTLEREVEIKKTMLQESLHRYRMLEQNTTQKADRHVDELKKQMEAKVTMLQQKINKLRTDLSDGQLEYRRLEARYTELEKSRQALLIEKSETVQRLQNKLEDSQRQCENLLSKRSQGDFEYERIRLNNKIRVLEQEHSEMRKKIAGLTGRLENTNAELELMDSLVHAQQNGTDESSEKKETNVDGTGYGFMQSNLIGSTPNNAPHLRDRAAGDANDRVVRLKNELVVCMTGQKEKREVIRQLETDLNTKDRELEQLKKEESHTLVQMNQYKEEAFRLSSKCRILERELEKLTSSNTITASDTGKSSNRRSSFDLRQEALEEKIFTLQQTKLETDDQIEQLKREKEQLSEQCRTLKAEHDMCTTLKLEVEKQKFLLTDAQNECDRLKRLYIQVSGTKDELARDLSTLRAQDSAKQIAALQEQVVSLERALQLAELKSSELAKMLDKEKTNHEEVLKQLSAGGDGSDRHQHGTPGREEKNLANNCTKCIDGLTQISKLEIENLKLQSSCTSHLRELGEMKIQLSDYQGTIAELHKRLDLKAERDQLIDELQEKAAQFEHIIRNKISMNSSTTTCDSATSPMKVSSRDQSVGTEDSPSDNSSESPVDAASARRQLREQEQKVREEMARAFAGQIKQIEERFRTQFGHFEENIDTLKSELYDRVAELKVRNQEVEVLKCAIVTEREKMREMLGKKDTEARALFDKQSELMNKYKTELANGQKKVQLLERELQEKRELVANERQSMEKLIAQLTAERTMYCEREQEMTDNFQEIEAEYQKSLDLVTEKYQSAKKTALNYKKYAEDKEQHMLKEYDRIKEGYNAALQKVQTRMKETLDNKEQDVREKMAKLVAEYETKMKLVKQSS
ncbi:centrosomal protein of 152 kDa [Anopheles nili]|uniref:centrosomal protein of 152 kDa n=1 Tax=Anopheles nili TaxID=185578 RepID=UPI00237BA4E0|nr:centrosomal protein of 152 kDa [Anopheles nili]